MTDGDDSSDFMEFEVVFCGSRITITQQKGSFYFGLFEDEGGRRIFIDDRFRHNYLISLLLYSIMQ